ncbi:zinc ribbon domain-containing protein [Streptomyces sp. A1547]|uniref:NADase-type glycan-binding domain-containing protein n=1 Tax=Streptomyces sp. A1547 TaxID=2563105 RepID=UPI00109E541B|nr:zinc ribbon domain-containing protein [Streptomyces sp. A1547]THA30928.1 zinc ribbon domain-containing protein [Streptomyces sp. A1547]
MSSQTPARGPGRDGAANCAECGTRAEPGQSFCDSCGSVLSWADRTETRGETSGPAPAAGDRPGARVEETVRAAARSDGGDDAGPGLADRADADAAPTGRGGAPSEPRAPQADSDGASPSRPASGGRGATEPGTAGADPAVGAGSSMLTAALVASPDDPAARARSLLVPVADPEARAAVTPSVAPVLPGRPLADRPQVRTPGREPGSEGGVPCPWCATPNRPDRHFCVLCSMPLSEGPAVPVRRPWWRRMLDFRNREAPWAGDRPRLRRGFGYLMTWVLWASVLALLITALVYTGDAVNAVRDHFAKRTPVGPDSIAASRSYPGHEPQLVFDKVNNTWWGPGVSQSGAGEWVEARFDRPTRLLDVIITPGVSTRADQLSQSALPHRVEAVITTADGKTTTRVLTLDQGAGGQRRTFRVGDTTAVRFNLRSAYGTAPDKQVAIAEIEFFGPSNSSRSQ